MAGTAVITENLAHIVKKIRWAWTSDASGDVNGILTVTKALEGVLLGFCTIPSVGTPPTDNYDIVLLDSDGHDVLAGQGLNRHTTNTQYIVSGLLAVAGTTLELRVSNAGISKLGTALMWMW